MTSKIDPKGEPVLEAPGRIVEVSSEPRSGQLSQGRPAPTIDLDGEVATARDDLRAGRLAEVISRLHPLVSSEGRGVPTAGPGSLGSALSVLARADALSGDAEAASAASDRALALLEAGRSSLTPQQEADLGVLLLDRHRAEEAVALLESATARQPDLGAEALGYLGMARREAGRTADAEQSFRAAVEAAPSDGHLRLELARTAAELGRDDAADQYDEAVGLLFGGDDLDALATAVDGLLGFRPDEPVAMAAKGELLRHLDRAPEAIEWLKRSVAASPDYAFARASLGAILTASGDYAGGLEHLDHAVAITPDYPFAQYWQVVALRGLGRPEEAIAGADRLIAVAGELPEVLTVKALALRDTGRMDMAVETLRRLATLSPEDGPVRTLLAETLLGAGQAAEALQESDVALGLLPDDPIALGIKGGALVALERPAEAVDFLSRSVEAAPTDWTVSNLARALAQLGRGDDALGVLDLYLADHPGDASLLALKGRVLVGLGRHDEAIAALTSAASAEPLSSSYVALSDALRGAGRSAEALEAAEKAADLAPDDVMAVGTRGQALRASGRLDEALVELARARTIRDDLWIQIEQAGLLESTGRYDDAIEIYRVGLAANPSNTTLMLAIGIDLRLAGKFDEAEAMDRQALDAGANEIDARNELAELFVAASRYPDALEQVDAILATDPTHLSALQLKTQALTGLERYEELLPVLDAILKQQPDDGRSLYMKALVLEALGRHDEALTVAEAAVRVLPDVPDIRTTLATIRKSVITALVSDGHADSALERVEGYLADEPGDASLLALKGTVLKELDRHDEAIEALTASASAEPLVSTYVALSDELRGAGRNDEALDAAQKAVDLDPEHAMAIGTHGQALRALGKLDEALAELDRARGIDDQSWIQAERAGVLFSLGRHDESLAAYKDVFDANPTNTALMLAVGVNLRTAGMFDEAEEFDRRALSAGHDEIAVRNELAELYVAANRYPEALDEVDAILAKDAGRLGAQQLKAQTLLGLGRYEEALPVLDAVLDRSGSADGWNLYLKAVALQAIDRLSEALAAAEAAIERLPDEPIVQTELASILTSCGEWARAVEAVEAIGGPAPETWDAATIGWASTVRGVAYWFAGRGDDAERAFREAASAEPQNSNTKVWLANAVRSAGRRDEGDALLREVIADSPEPRTLDPSDVANLGWAHFMLGEFEAAADLLARALSKSPTLAWAQFDFALTLLASGEGSSAIREYERAMDQLRSQPDPRRRYGLVAVALEDLEHAYPSGRDSSAPSVPPARSPDLDRARSMLQEQLEAIARERDQAPGARATRGLAGTR